MASRNSQALKSRRTSSPEAAEPPPPLSSEEERALLAEQNREASELFGMVPVPGKPGQWMFPVRYALDLRFRNYSREGLLAAYMAHAMMTGAPVPSADRIRRMADAIGLPSHDYDALRAAAATQCRRYR